MSISLRYSNPISDEQQLLDIPIATEREFEEIWKPSAEELELKYVPLFNLGLEISYDDLNDVIDELKTLESKLTNLNNQETTLSKPLERLKMLIDKLPKIVSRNSEAIIG